jgi:hypothetical protein
MPSRSSARSSVQDSSSSAVRAATIFWCIAPIPGAASPSPTTAAETFRAPPLASILRQAQLTADEFATLL